MYPSWLETAGRLSVPFYFFVMGGFLMVIIIRAVQGNTRPGSDLRSRMLSTGAPRGGDDRRLAPTGGFPILDVAEASSGGFPRPVPESRRSRLNRLLFEYVGNLQSQAEENPYLQVPLERRRNWEARKHLNWIKEQMQERGFSAAKSERFLEDLREVARYEEGTVSDDKIKDIAPG